MFILEYNPKIIQKYNHKSVYVTCTPLQGLLADLGGGVGAGMPPVGVDAELPIILCLCLTGNAGGKLSLVVVGLCKRSAAGGFGGKTSCRHES